MFIIAKPDSLGCEFIAFKIECIYFISSRVFDFSCCNLGAYKGRCRTLHIDVPCQLDPTYWIHLPKHMPWENGCADGSQSQLPHL